MNWLNWLIANIIKKKQCDKHTKVRLGTQVKKKKKNKKKKNQDLESVKQF